MFSGAFAVKSRPWRKPGSGEAFLISLLIDLFIFLFFNKKSKEKKIKITD